MSRTYRTGMKSYYGGVEPVSRDEKRHNLTPETEYYRKRWYHGYDGGWRGGIAEHVRCDGLHYRYSWRERGHGRNLKKTLRRQVQKSIRRAARAALRDLD